MSNLTSGVRCIILLTMATEENPRTLSEVETQRIRDSVAEGVERVVKPFLKRVEAQSHVHLPGSVKIKDKAEPLMTPRPGGDEYDPSRIPSAAEVRASVRRDAKRLLDPYLKRAQQQRGLTKKLARTRIR